MVLAFFSNLMGGLTHYGIGSTPVFCGANYAPLSKMPDSQIHIHWKGAAEIVLASCTQYIDAAGQLVAMDEDKAMVFKKAIGDMASGSLRCVAMAYRLYEVEKVPSTEEQLDQWALPEDDLDPCRPGVKVSVQLCQNAGIKVRMVTGDNIQTAKAIASECGILGSNDDVTEPTLIEGRVFRELPELQREEIVDQISVMGRSSPNDKLLLVQALRKRGHVVAVTGDGTNDAPALHEADIGLAMGISGTEVAKESSDIVILDDNFASVVKLLWVNLIMDTLGALALATEPPTDHLMDRPPVGRREPLITNIMWRNLLIQALYQVTVLLVLNFQGISILKLKGDTIAHATKVKNTLIFNAFVLCQIFNEFNARKPDEFNVFKGITKNYLFMGIVGATVVLQVLIIEFLGKFTATVRLSWSHWLISVIIGIIRLVYIEDLRSWSSDVSDTGGTSAVLLFGVLPVFVDKIRLCSSIVEIMFGQNMMLVPKVSNQNQDDEAALVLSIPLSRTPVEDKIIWPFTPSDSYSQPIAAKWHLESDLGA
ncbi:calcium-transporting atpase 8 [Quercus suber]|uniref:Calcium-transporting atpase 8 n=1 Tax=Quercus suber TaxID=58331 RepID=A0AAW0J150_QUESU